MLDERPCPVKIGLLWILLLFHFYLIFVRGRILDKH
jgi:hypothetical protein